ncbi:MAG TPA: lamin tail domain-containing protein [Saprospiraceae bacterium]|nr:lamin tail domain-containing protein [Saprospiraceae bacterium]
MTKFSKLSLAVLFAFMLNICSAQLTITEISYNPPESGTDSLEYIEVLNTSGATLDLTGFSFSAGVEYNFEGTLAKDAYLVISKSATAMLLKFGVEAIPWTEGTLNNAGEAITIINASGDTIDHVNYDDVNGWPNEAAGTDGAGASIELCDPISDNTLAASWKVSKKSAGILINDLVLYGTPGQDPQCEIVPAETVIASFEKTFTPQNVTIFVGETVLWKNAGGHHNVNGSIAKFPNNPDSFGFSEASDTMWTYQFTFTKKGAYDYVCDPHEAEGMVGKVIVVEKEITTGFKRELLVQHVDVYPNPTSGLVRFDNPIQISSGVIFNMQGQIISTLKSGQYDQIDFKDMKSGLYIIQMLSKEGMSVTKVAKE